MSKPKKYVFGQNSAGKNRSGQCGFSLVEAMIAMVILLIALLGVFITFTYAVSYNAGNNSRSQALAVLQQKTEQLRSAKFTPTITDSILQGGKKAQETVSAADGNQFLIDVTVDDDPFTANTQINNNTTFKEIAITVNLASPTPGWQTSVPINVTLRRVRAN